MGFYVADKLLHGKGYHHSNKVASQKESKKFLQTTHMIKGSYPQYIKNSKTKDQVHK